MNNLKCEEIETLINENIDGEISERNKTLLYEHLAGCDNCRKVTEEIKSILEASSYLPKDISPEKDLWNGIEKQMLLEKKRFGMDKTEVKKGWGKYSYYYYALAAVFVLAAIVILFRYADFKPNTDIKGPVYLDVGQFWKVTGVEGSPKIENEENPSGKTVSGADSMKIGEWLVTDSVSKAVINVSNIGTIKLGPKSKVKLVKSAAGDYRIKLEYGTIDANINTEPRNFFVETKSVTAVDLGCEYTLTSEENGDGVVYVKSGKVSLESPNRATLVPAGQYCMTREGIGPGTPYSADASEELKRALINFDFRNCETECVNKVINSAGKKDAITLINMIPRVDSLKKITIVEKLDRYTKTPGKIPRDSIYKFNSHDWEKWSEEFEKDLHENLEKNLENLDEKIHIQIEKNMELLDKTMENMEIEIDKKFDDENDKGEKYKFKFRHFNDKNSEPEYFEFNDSIPFDKEKFKKDMEKMQKDLQKMNKDLNMNKEEIQKMVDEALENVKDMKIEIKIDKEELKKEIQKEINEHKEEIKKHKEEIKKEIEEQRKEQQEEKEELKKEQKEEKEEIKKEQKEEINEIPGTEERRIEITIEKAGDSDDSN